MKIVKLSAVIVTGVLSIVSAQTPAAAASVATNIFLTNIMPNVDFLDRSSALATTNQASARVRAFAHGESIDQAPAIKDLDAWIAADPVVIAAQTGSSPDQVFTGRSVAVSGQSTQPVDTRLALGQEDIDALEGFTGRDFDAQYKAKQLDALTQVQTDYQEYLETGDDPVLLAIAKRELPKIDRRLLALKKI